ncbi:Transmembrane protein 144 homolog [Caenorhabditis elegans]|uniref:Transmembrane protein 144 homolog n=1 Tax=Caenorhabditis elegans TaxID=6239 RepID=TM144_CAEEL|nr:Transmembrane protein 144 homolog [Caenorhabditis elegans]Q10000.3 RecName: Full=Transmembrane protein 144 homolog [Caenorhabditis elegans]CCD65875.1 Transmembrane protein 144 homolog [Caenorhabditis elegans]|eukprot:NP_498062.2 Transmembrane protein 144 homolog [Caenorhabditis elegans]
MSIAVGLSACALSSVLFGSMFVPVKKCHSGNGIFVQWIMSTAILLVGIVVYSTQGFPEFEPLAMLGGMFWALGNATAVPIMNTIGIGMGMLVWGTTNCVAGWAAGRFGLFGINSTVPEYPFLNYFGLVLVVFGGFLFSQIRPNEPQTASERSPLMVAPDDDLTDDVAPDDSDIVVPRGGAVPTRAHRNQKRLLAIITSLVAGVFYGFTFVPVIYIQDHPEIYPTAPKTGLGYVFSHYIGIFCTASALMIGYVIYSRNNPFASSRLVGPSMTAGSMWGIAQASWFVANDNLSQAVSFPIISMVPGVIAALWSVFYFRDISGSRNLRLLSIAVAITLIGAICVGVSK